MTTVTSLHALSQLTLALDDEIDLAVAAAVLRELRALVDAGPAAVRVDLSGVAFLDCAGLRALEDAQRYGARRGVPLTLAAPSRAVTRLATLLGDRFGGTLESGLPSGVQSGLDGEHGCALAG